MSSPADQRNALANSGNEEAVQHAVAIITMTEYCRSQAEALGKCNEAHGNQAESKCAVQHKAFGKCAQENFAKAFVDLRQVAARQCTAEVAAFQECRAKATSPNDCVAEDLAALGCASRLVLSSFRRPS